MNCNEVNELLPQYAARVLPQDMNMKVISHIAVCPVCRADMAFWISVRGAMAAIDSAIKTQEAPFQPKARPLSPLEGTVKAVGTALGFTANAVDFALSYAR